MKYQVLFVLENHKKLSQYLLFSAVDVDGFMDYMYLFVNNWIH